MTLSVNDSVFVGLQHVLCAEPFRMAHSRVPISELMDQY
jgi:hypothetical protein